MPDSNSQDGMSNAGDEEPVDSPQMPPEEPVDGGGGAHELRLVYQGNAYTIAPDKLQAALELLRTIVPPDKVSMFGSDPVNQQGTHEGLPVQEKRKESFPEDAALGMQRKKGKVVYEEGSSSGSAQRLCTECGISSIATLMLSGPDGPETLCNECGLQWATKENVTDSSQVSVPNIQEPSAMETELSNEEAKESDGSSNVDGK